MPAGNWRRLVHRLDLGTGHDGIVILLHSRVKFAPIRRAEMLPRVLAHFLNCRRVVTLIGLVIVLRRFIPHRRLGSASLVNVVQRHPATRRTPLENRINNRNAVLRMTNGTCERVLASTSRRIHVRKIVQPRLMRIGNVALVNDRKDLVHRYKSGRIVTKTATPLARSRNRIFFLIPLDYVSFLLDF
jgi:hypothetical protein